MDREEAEYKICQYCHLWTLYAEHSVELKRKAELSQESAVAACKVYVPYISDILRQLDEAMKIFAIEKELRLIKNRGYFPVPQITPKNNKIETSRDKNKILEAVDEEATAMLNADKQSEENYVKEQEQVRVRDRSDFNYLTLANSTTTEGLTGIKETSQFISTDGENQDNSPWRLITPTCRHGYGKVHQHRQRQR